jgi:aspartate racemase
VAQIECFSLAVEMENANSLLKSSEAKLPENIKTVIRFCCERQVGFVLSRNVKVYSCKDARSNRSRLGHIGIPLFDELKSIVFVGCSKNGDEVIVAAHCRGHMNIIVERLIEICSLRSVPEIMPEEQLEERFGMQFGTVNPMLLDINSNSSIINIFDVSLTKKLAQCPGTMMTNAGDLTWGIELDSALLIKTIPNSMVENIAKDDKELEYFEIPQSTNPKSIGIITGNGPDSGIALWNRINAHFVELLDDHFLGDISLPKVSVVSLPAMGLSMELDKRDHATWETLEEAINKLQFQDVELLALACHTTHYYTAKIRDLFEHNGKSFISMPEATIDYVRQSQLTDLAVIGISYVADLQGYSAYSELKDFNIETISSKILKKFHEIGYDVKKMKNLHHLFQKFTDLLNPYTIKSDNVLIALTELSILIESQKKRDRRGKQKNIIDPLDIYARELARLSLSIAKEDVAK